jgi:hypothetical protein
MCADGRCRECRQIAEIIGHNPMTDRRYHSHRRPRPMWWNVISLMWWVIRERLALWPWEYLLLIVVICLPALISRLI